MALAYDVPTCFRIASRKYLTSVGRKSPRLPTRKRQHSVLSPSAQYSVKCVYSRQNKAETGGLNFTFGFFGTCMLFFQSRNSQWPRRAATFKITIVRASYSECRDRDLIRTSKFFYLSQTGNPKSSPNLKFGSHSLWTV